MESSNKVSSTVQGEKRAPEDAGVNELQSEVLSKRKRFRKRQHYDQPTHDDAHDGHLPPTYVSSPNGDIHNIEATLNAEPQEHGHEHYDATETNILSSVPRDGFHTTQSEASPDKDVLPSSSTDDQASADLARQYDELKEAHLQSELQCAELIAPTNGREQPYARHNLQTTQSETPPDEGAPPGPSTDDQASTDLTRQYEDIKEMYVKSELERDEMLKRSQKYDTNLEAWSLKRREFEAEIKDLREAFWSGDSAATISWLSNEKRALQRTVQELDFKVAKLESHFTTQAHSNMQRLAVLEADRDQLNE